MKAEKEVGGDKIKDDKIEESQENQEKGTCHRVTPQQGKGSDIM